MRGVGDCSHEWRAAGSSREGVFANSGSRVCAAGRAKQPNKGEDPSLPGVSRVGGALGASAAQVESRGKKIQVLRRAPGFFAR